MPKKIKPEFVENAKNNSAAASDPFNEDAKPEVAPKPVKAPSRKRRKNQDEMQIQNSDDAFLADALKEDEKAKSQPATRWDEIIIAENRSKFGAQIDMLEKYRENMMRIFGVHITLPLDIPFRAGKNYNDNDLKPSVFLGKLIENTEVVQVQSKEGAPVDVVVTQFEHIRIGYKERQLGEKKVGTFMAGNFANDHNLGDKDDVDARRAVIEIVKTAFLLAEHAKAAGWTEVNFGRTEDPIKRFALMQACKHVGLVCSSEVVNANDLPQDSVLGSKIDMHVGAYALKVAQNIYVPMEKQGMPHVENPAAKAAKAAEPQPQPQAA